MRSPFAHARVVGVGPAVARALPGVDLVLTAADLDGVVGVMQGAGPAGLHTPAFGPLATDRVRFVGDPVAIVVAATRALAEDARELVDVQYEPLPALPDVDAALDERAPAVFDEVGHNLMFEGHWTYGDPDGQFASAARTNRWQFTQHRQCNAPLEGRAGLVDHDPDSGDLTYHAAHQDPHALRLFVADPVSAGAQLEALVLETVELVEQYMPQVDTARARRRIGWRSQAWTMVDDTPNS